MTPEMRQELIKRLQAANHKAGVDKSDWESVQDNILIIADWYLSYCEHRNLRQEFTRIKDKPIPGVSVSDSHKDRAFDASVIGWTDADARECAFQCNVQLKGHGAVSKRDLKERAAVFEPDEYKDGRKIKTRHLHFQGRPS